LKVKDNKVVGIDVIARLTIVIRHTIVANLIAKAKVEPIALVNTASELEF
jgi:hypothetical protein